MAFALTYTNLLTTLEAYLARQDANVVAQLPLFILLAQQRIVREMKLLGFRQEITGNYDATCISTGIMQKPSDWRKTIAFYSGTGTGNNTHTPVFERPYEYIREVYPNIVTGITPSLPRFYADADYNHWLIGPAPDQGYPYKIAYYATLTFLDATTGTNWLTINAPDLLIYACLLEAVPFVKADERIPVWQAMYANAKQALQMQELEGLYDTQAQTGEPQTPPYMKIQGP